jgi:uncharacterized protein (TIGR01777 family)
VFLVLKIPLSFQTGAFFLVAFNKPRILLLPLGTMEGKTVMISGGTGMVGTALADHLVQAGYSIIILTRNPAAAEKKYGQRNNIRFAAWDIDKQTIDTDAVASANALVHLAGAGVVDKPWTNEYKKVIRESRVNSSRLLVKAIAEHGSKLSTVVSASAIGWYGADKPDHPLPFAEDMPYAPGFLGDTCRDWEDSIKPMETLGKRLVISRIGIVLSNSGGALPEFKKPLAFRVAGVLGSGKQMVSWVHIKDLCGIFQYALEQENMCGIYNATAPNPVSNKELTIALAKTLYGNSFVTLPVPEFVLKIMMGERSIEVLKSTTTSSEKLVQSGFDFRFKTIGEAVSDLVKGK